MTFDLSYHTIFDVKKAYCDEHDNSVTPDKLIFRAKTNNSRQSKTLEPDNATLANVGIKGRISVITMSYKLHGGALYIPNGNILDSKRNRKLNTSDSEIKITTKADCVYGDKSGQKKAEMPCGHAYGPETMFGLLKNLMRKNMNQYEPKCSICKKVFDFDLCAKVADLNDDEYLYFLNEIEKRCSPETKPCPTCKRDCDRPESLKKFRVNCASCSGGDWCFMCGGKWYGGGFTVCGNSNCESADINIQLKECALKKTTYGTGEKMVEVPEMRACPNCLAFIDHSDACKHMTCISCSHEFCFSCLKPKLNGKWQCPTYTIQCPIAPRQVLK
eukprot:478245_1